jgi:hypothetical protein
MWAWSATLPDQGILSMATMRIAVALPIDAASTDPSTGFRESESREGEPHERVCGS